ncbi:MAG: hypothetical protein ACXU8N_15075 [Telluria sp.]
MPTMFCVKALLVTIGLVVGYSSVAASPQVIRAKFPGEVETEDLRILTPAIMVPVTERSLKKRLGNVKISGELHRVLTGSHLSSAFLFSFEGRNARFLLLTNQPSRLNHQASYCGGGHEMKVYLLNVAQRTAQISDRIDLEGCSMDREVARERSRPWDVQVSGDQIGFRRQCDPDGVTVSARWDSGKFRARFALKDESPTSYIARLLAEAPVNPSPPTLDLRGTAGAPAEALSTKDSFDVALRDLLSISSKATPLASWHSPAGPLWAVEFSIVHGRDQLYDSYLVLLALTFSGEVTVRQIIPGDTFSEKSSNVAVQRTQDTVKFRFEDLSTCALPPLSLKGSELVFETTSLRIPELDETDD